MSLLKIAFYGIYDQGDIENSVFFYLLKSLSKKKIEIVRPGKEDILIIGPYNSLNLKKKILDKLISNNYLCSIQKFFPNLYVYPSNRSYKPLKIFLSHENIHSDIPDYDFSFTHDLGIVGKNHLRFPIWKDHIDWSHEGVKRQQTLTSKRFGFYWNIDSLTVPQGNKFLDKPKKMSIITSHMNEPRKSIYLKFKENFIVDGYGPFFNKKISHHNNSNFKIYDILKDYAFNLCPENSLFPGYYNERVPNAFLSKTLPITWADQNIKEDFNPKAFINLIDYCSDGYNSITEMLKDEIFLKQFANQPLLLQKPNLDNEKKFIEKILLNI